jgi:NitT/TauT family transport system permease protein
VDELVARQVRDRVALAASAAEVTTAPERPPIAAAATGRRAPRLLERFTRPSFWKMAGLRTLGLVILVAAWIVIARIVDDPDLLPGPGAVGSRLWDLIQTGQFQDSGVLSLRRVVLGFLLGFGVAVPVGVALGRVRLFEAMFGSFVFLALTVPSLAYGVIFMILIGLNEKAAVIAVAASTTPMLILNVWEGTKALDRDLTEMAQVFKASKSQMVRHIVLPSLSPYLFAAVRLGMSLAWKIVVVVELLGLSSGVGYGINQGFNNFDMELTLAWVLGFSVVMAGIEFVVMRPIEAHVLRWRPPASGRA